MMKSNKSACYIAMSSYMDHDVHAVHDQHITKHSKQAAWPILKQDAIDFFILGRIQNWSLAQTS